MTPAGNPIRRAWHDQRGRTGVLLLALVTAIAIFAPPFLADPAEVPDPVGSANLAPSATHPLGTDALSRDVLARVVSGARVSLSVGFLAVLLSISLGATIGLVAGYLGGAVDAALMRVVDAALAIPRLFVLLLLLAGDWRAPLTVLILLIGATGWFSTARLVRGEVLRLREENYVSAAEALGAKPGRIMFRHLLPNTLGPLLVAATLGVGDVILLEAGLSFLGLGVQAPTPSWGGMILDGKPYLATAPWVGLFPGLAIVLTVLSANLLGDALRDAVDPRGA